MKRLHNRIQSAASTPKGKVIVAGILLTMVIAVVLSVVYWNAIKERLIRNQVNLKVREKTDRLYDVHYSNMEIDEVGGNLSISDILFQYDSARYLAMKAQKKEATAGKQKIFLSIYFGVRYQAVTADGS